MCGLKRQKNIGENQIEMKRINWTYDPNSNLWYHHLRNGIIVEVKSTNGNIWVVNINPSRLMEKYADCWIAYDSEKRALSIAEQLIKKDLWK